MDDSREFHNVKWAFAKNNKEAISKASRLAKGINDDLTCKFTLISRAYSVAQATELRHPIPLDLKHELEEYYEWVASGRYKTGASTVMFNMTMKDGNSFTQRMKMLDAQSSLLQGYAHVDDSLLRKQALALTGKLFDTIDGGLIHNDLVKKVNQIHTLMLKRIRLNKRTSRVVTLAPSD